MHIFNNKLGSLTTSLVLIHLFTKDKYLVSSLLWKLSGGEDSGWWPLLTCPDKIYSLKPLQSWTSLHRSSTTGVRSGIDYIIYPVINPPW